ncbi:MAG TPA: TMEM43 family protein [Xanthomonadaceae bacterium]|jgi:hypothetical protein|nr:TMEM43 family protein [Xanthomonadaceae bacterium]
MKGLLLTAALLIAISVSAQTPALSASPPVAITSASPRGQIESVVAVADPVFGVHAKVLGLERGVEMLQWRKVERPAPPHYEQVWATERIDSRGFDATHRNPGDLPFNGERWWTTDPQLEGHPVSPDVLAALGTWAPLKPDLSQLPTNLAVSFQPDGDWLSTSQDPAHPQVGDLRVRWRMIGQAPAPAGTLLVAGRWELHALAKAVAMTQVAPSRPAIAVPTHRPHGDVRQWMQSMFADWLVWLIAGALTLALLLLLWKRRRPVVRKKKPARRSRRGS